MLGRLADDPKLLTTNSGVSVCHFRIAVQRRFANQQGVREADFLPVVAWQKLADICGKYLSKGKQCVVVGSIQTRNYEAQDGSKRYVTEIIAEEVHFVGSNEKNTDTGAQAATGASSTAPAQQAAGGDFEEVDDDELPF